MSCRPSRLFPGRVVAEGSSLGQRRRSGRRVGRMLCGSTPEDTVSSGAIRDESRSSTRVLRLSLRGCVRATVVGANPRDGPVSPVALFLSLIPFHSPMRRTRPMSLPPSRYQRFVCALLRSSLLREARRLLAVD